MPEQFLIYLDRLIEEARVDLNSALDELADYNISMARAARLTILIQVRAEAGSYDEPA